MAPRLAFSEARMLRRRLAGRGDVTPAPAHTRHERVAAASPDDRYHAPGTSRG
jgi:hypothetical protein